MSSGSRNIEHPSFLAILIIYEAFIFFSSSEMSQVRERKFIIIIKHIFFQCIYMQGFQFQTFRYEYEYPLRKTMYFAWKKILSCCRDIPIEMLYFKYQSMFFCKSSFSNNISKSTIIELLASSMYLKAKLYSNCKT